MSPSHGAVTAVGIPAWHCMRCHQAEKRSFLETSLGQPRGDSAEPPGQGSHRVGVHLLALSSPPVLCAERVVRITKTYHDIDAVTNLLDEVRWRSHLSEGWGDPGDAGVAENGGRDESQLRRTCPLQKERDLELAARIGQSLLKQNRSLTERNELLEEQLELAKEEVRAPGHRPWCPACPPGAAVVSSAVS